MQEFMQGAENAEKAGLFGHRQELDVEEMPNQFQSALDS
jgi:hypothetical protein